MFDLLTYDSDGRPKLTVTVENKNPTLVVFFPQNGIPPATNYATRDIRNLTPVLDFDSSTSESIYFVGLMPQQYQGNGLSAYIYFTCDATSGDVDWDLGFDKYTTDLDIDSTHVLTTTSSDNNTVSSTSGKIITAEVKIGTSALDGINAGDLFLLKLSRDIADTASGDANFVALELRGT
ncbi:MAG: hypothetical protein Unbinned97contig1000_14 [Prokaryotic dsDNA virus sp.]|nr:MAG: hypothetical protein Unbinned97contig1000_14 [Prokaryotic dsDNA virus sp.]|tara:strand:- start:2143 stop:2679 length:537 start_codon:yes stop_codon:yes gene_type:complete